MKVNKYILPSSLDEALKILRENPKSKILGGGLFLRLQKINIPILIDCAALISNEIKVNETIIIGAYTTLRSLEKDDRLPEALVDSVKQISGIGTRNLATIGGSICGRYPFSDVNVALVALDAQLEFFKSGTCSMRDFNEKGLDEDDILLNIKIPTVYFSKTRFYKKVYTDFSFVNVAVADHTVAVGARPGRPVYISDVNYDLSAKKILENVKFTTDFKGSGDYRRALAEARLSDIISEMGGHHGS